MYLLSCDHMLYYSYNSDLENSKMFHSFANSEDRRNFGGSAFIEFQYCKLKRGLDIGKIISIKTINNWQDDSLYVYVDDIDEFYRHYADIFNVGVYNNLKTGKIDFYGINYYTQQQLLNIVDTIDKQKPFDYAVLSEWLKQGINYNGFYILGI